MCGVACGLFDCAHRWKIALEGACFKVSRWSGVAVEAGS